LKLKKALPRNIYAFNIKPQEGNAIIYNIITELLYYLKYTLKSHPAVRQNIINFLIFRAAKSFKGYLISKHSISHFFQLKWLCTKYKRKTGLTAIKHES